MVLGQTCLIGQITLRCSNIEKSLEFYQEILGMKLLSIQQVEAYGFTLYFLAFTDETPPNEDLNSIEIREWLWQRPYTTIELQHIPGAKLQAKLYIQSNISINICRVQLIEDV
jgi:catechol 2,3-dioxygenase-like lactoylglutathione lyase family enzyme